MFLLLLVKNHHNKAITKDPFMNQIKIVVEKDIANISKNHKSPLPITSSSLQHLLNAYPHILITKIKTHD